MTDEWENAADWSGLPDVYVTKAECQQGMFWRIEACSVPMAIGPEVRLIRADRVAALEAARAENEALRAERNVAREALMNAGVALHVSKRQSAEIMAEITALRASLAQAEAQVKALREALRDAHSHQVAACAEWEAEMAKARGVAKHKMLAARYAGHHAAMNDLAKRITALTASDASNGREG